MLTNPSVVTDLNLVLQQIFFNRDTDGMSLFVLQTFLIFDVVIRPARNINHRLLFAWPLVCSSTNSTCWLVMFINSLKKIHFQSRVDHNLILYIFR